MSLDFDTFSINGSGGDFVSSTSVKNIVSISQADYDLLDAPDSKTLYLITEA